MVRKGKDIVNWVKPFLSSIFINFHCTHNSRLAIFESWGKDWDTIKWREVVCCSAWAKLNTKIGLHTHHHKLLEHFPAY